MAALGRESGGSFIVGEESFLPRSIAACGPLEEAGEKQAILGIWVLREVLNRLPRMAAERPTRLTKEACDELIAEAKNELAILKAKGRRLRKEEIDPVITDLQRLTGWSESTVIDSSNLSKKKCNLLQLPSRPCAAIAGTNRRDRAFEALCPAPYSLDSSASHF